MLGYTREEFIEKVQDGWSRFVDIDLRMVMREHHEELSLIHIYIHRRIRSLMICLEQSMYLIIREAETL